MPAFFLKVEKFIVSGGRISGWLVFPLMFFVLLDILFRKLRGVIAHHEVNETLSGHLYELLDSLLQLFPSSILQELQWHTHSCFFVFGLAFTLLLNKHVRVDFFHERFSKRTKIWIEEVGFFLLVLPLTGILLFYGFQYVSISFIQNEVSSNINGLPYRWFVKSFVPLSFLFLFMAATISLYKICRKREED